MNIQDQPLVTVYIPTYNRVELLKRAVKSVQEQTYQNFELIIVDDCSTDGTQEYLKYLSEKDSRVKVFFKDKNSGACVSRNIAIQNANGKYITGLDDDDYFLPNRVQIFIKYAVEKDIDFSCCSFYVKESNRLIKSNSFEGYIGFDQIKNNNLIDNQVFVKTDYMRMIGGFDDNAPGWQDYDLWFRMIKQIKPCFRINQYTYVKDISHEMARITTTSKAYKGYLYFIEKHRNDLDNSNLKSLYILDKINRKENLKLKDLFLNFNFNTCFIFLKRLAPNFLIKMIR